MGEGNRGERTIGSGHLVALFLGIVVLCCVFFILGYEMGRAQFEKGGAAVAAKGPSPAAPAKPNEEPSAWPGSATSAGSAPAESAAPSAAAPPAGASAKREPAPAASHAAKPAPAAPASKAGSSAGLDPAYRAPQIPRGAIVLQVAANKNQSDALSLAKVLQDKGFPAFVLTPAADEWYRVQVGPFADAKTADQAKAALAKEGFKAIVKR